MHTHWLLNSAATIIAPSLTKILNLSISSGIFPMQWKISKVCPVQKGGSRTDKSNYRPIAILAVISWIIGRYVYTRFYNSLSTKNVLYKLQSGFRAGFSYETTLAHTVDLWYQNIENGEPNGLVFLDLQKVFDMLDHDVLLHELKLYQCYESTLSWSK